MVLAQSPLAFHPLPASPPALEPPLSPLSDLSPSPPQVQPHIYATRTRQSSGTTRPSRRLREAVGDNAAAQPPASAQPPRRIRPLACMTPNIALGAEGENTNRDKAWKKGAWRAGSMQQTIEFPPKHVVLHPDDANNKVFVAMGRAFMSVDNCAMTVKDLAELSMRHGLVCQNASAAAQAITFFIRSHLQRCEVEQDFPLLLRHVLSGTPKDDALAPALYSRTGGNVSNKDKNLKDENGKEVPERLTCFRRGTTVWYLSKAAGAPCPFARAGIALRDYAEVSAITGVESRKGVGAGAGGDCRGMKRKRERTGLRHRMGSKAVGQCEDEESSAEERRPPKIKLTLRLRPCLTSMREKTEPEEEEESSSSSDSNSDSDSGEEPMDVDTLRRPAAPLARALPIRECEPAWTFPPFPIQRRIPIPPYTPSEETYPTIYTSPSTNLTASASSEWSAPLKPKLELVCVDTPPRTGPNTPGLGSYYHRSRAASMPFSVASPPPESDDEFVLGDDDDDDFSFTLSPEVPVKREDDSFAYVWPQAATSSSSFDLEHIKSESDFDDFNGTSSSKRSSTQTIMQVKPEELDFNFDALSLSFHDEPTFGLSIKYESDGFASGSDDGFSWGQPVDLTQDEPVCDLAAVGDQKRTETDAALEIVWKDAELLGPDSVRLQELEDNGWDNVRARQDPSSISKTRTPLVQHDNDAYTEKLQSPGLTFHLPPLRYSPSPELEVRPMSSAFFSESMSSPPSLAGSVQTWSAGSPGSIGPASPSSSMGPESPAAMREEEPASIANSDSYDIEHSAPWMIPGKQLAPSVPSRRIPRADISDIVLSEVSAPWERGMISQEDVEEHLLAPAPMAMMALNMPPLAKVPLESAAAVPELPLSPQEEAVFQSFCMCPDMEWDEQQVRTRPEADTTAAQEVAKAIQAQAAFANVFAAATRPSSALRGKRPGMRQSIEKEQARKQERGCTEEFDEDAGADADYVGMSRSSHSKEKSTTSMSGSANGKGPLRRSKRVANAAANQRNRERLRKRLTTA